MTDTGGICAVPDCPNKAQAGSEYCPECERCIRVTLFVLCEMGLIRRRNIPPRPGGAVNRSGETDGS